MQFRGNETIDLDLLCLLIFVPQVNEPLVPLHEPLVPSGESSVGIAVGKSNSKEFVVFEFLVFPQKEMGSCAPG